MQALSQGCASACVVQTRQLWYTLLFQVLCSVLLTNLIVGACEQMHMATRLTQKTGVHSLCSHVNL